MKTIAILLLILWATPAFTQEAAPSPLRIGLYAFAGASMNGGYGRGMPMHGGAYAGGYYRSYRAEYHYSESLGAGLSFNAPIQQHFSLAGHLGYSNRKENHMEPSFYRPDRYSFSFIDVWALGQYNTRSYGGIRFTAALGFAESTLIAAKRSYYITNNLGRIDFGVLMGPGIEADLKQAGAIQIRLLYQLGLRGPLSSTNYYYGMHSGGTNFFLQVGYLFN